MAKTPVSPSEARAGDRIAKLLARAGVASRREVERMIEDGRIARDGVAIDTPATVLSSLQGVTVDGQPVALAEPTRLFLFHKPTGLLVAERDPKGRPTIYDRLPRDLPRLVPVGRLDLNTEGLLLLTTDGGFKRQLELPATGVERSYRVRAYGNIHQSQLEELAEGIEIEGIRYGSIDANIERRTGANVWIEMTLTEGKNREVRRVLEHLGLQVSRLIRTRYGPFVLGDLPTGDIGEVKQHELVAFRRTLKGGAPEEIGAPAVEPRAGFRSAPTVDRAARARTRGPTPNRDQAPAPVTAREPEGRRRGKPGDAPRPVADRAARPPRSREGTQSDERPQRPNRPNAGGSERQTARTESAAPAGARPYRAAASQRSGADRSGGDRSGGDRSGMGKPGGRAQHRGATTSGPGARPAQPGSRPTRGSSPGAGPRPPRPAGKPPRGRRP